jgi:ABC-type cobalamin/Fe3+-siderophores transport system ATPase subunit
MAALSREMTNKRVVSDQEKKEALVAELLRRIRGSTRRTSNGRVTYLIGDNGTGKSRLLASVADCLRQPRPTRTVACIANSIYDRFNVRDREGLRYLGARNAPNAVFHTAIDRQLSRLILQAMLLDRKLLSQLQVAIKMSFSFSLGDYIDAQVKKLIDVGRRRSEREDLMSESALAMLKRISKAGGRFDRLTLPQIRVFLRYLELNIDFDLHVHLPDGRVLKFEDLSTGEQNRTLLFAKILSAAEERSVFLIDEPEISLHLHWQMGFHKTLMELLSHLQRFHVVVATHAPIVISEAARLEPDSRLNKVAVLRRMRADGASLVDHSPGEDGIAHDFHTFADVASHEQLVLRYFQTAPYHAREVSVEIADAVLSVAEGVRRASDAKTLLLALRDVVGLTVEAQTQIDAAVDLINRNVLRATRAGSQHEDAVQG